LVSLRVKVGWTGNIIESFSSLEEFGSPSGIVEILLNAFSANTLPLEPKEAFTP